MPERALITGITGQDGSYLAEFLLDRGYEVFGLIRRSSSGPNLDNIPPRVLDDIQLVQGDMTDAASLRRAIAHARPDEIYNLAAQSFVPMSWDSPIYTMAVNLTGFTYLLEAVRDLHFPVRNPQDKGIKIYQASTSEMFGNSIVMNDDGLIDNVEEKNRVLNEDSPMRPRSPYGISKLGAHRMAAVYRESFGMYVASGILFNHESPRRGPMFVSRKISKWVASYYAGRDVGPLKLGDLEAMRDWGFAGDYVRAMWLMLQQDKPKDFVIGTGSSRAVEDLVFLAFQAGAEITDGEAPDDPIADYVEVKSEFKRPAEIFNLRADASRAVAELGWRPAIDLYGLMKMMVREDLRREGVSMK